VGVAFGALTGFTRADAAPAGDRYRDAVLAKSPVAYWRLDELDGPAVDATGHGHKGSYVGGITYGEPGALRDSTDPAIGLNGTDAFVQIPDNAAFSQGASGKGLTVEVWMRPDLLSFAGEEGKGYIHWLGKGQAGSYEWGFRFYSSSDSSRPNRISAYIWNPSGGEGAGAYFQDRVKAKEWIHIVACYDPGNASIAGRGVSIYKNAKLRGSPATQKGALYSGYAIHPVHGAAPVKLGTRDGGSFLAGALDEVAIYPRVLSASEIAGNFHASRIKSI
jgi:hypothetical protein